MLCTIVWQSEKAVENSVSCQTAADKLPDQLRSTRDILHLIQSRASDGSPGPAASSSATGNESGGPRKFQARPQLFEAILMPSSSADVSRCNAENDASSAQPEQQSTTSWFIFRNYNNYYYN